MSNRKTICLAALLTLCAPAAANAQTQRPAATPTAPIQTPAPTASPQPAPQAASQVSEDEADLAITANVTASSLRFEAVPNVTVEFPGKPRRETAWEAERTNLPRPVQPGVTYRDVGVRLKIVSVFADIDRIVAEALGEVPSSDDQARPDATRPDASARTADTTGASGTAATDDAATRRGDDDELRGSQPAPSLKGSRRAAGVASGSRVRVPRRAGAQRAGRLR